MPTDIFFLIFKEIFIQKLHQGQFRKIYFFLPFNMTFEKICSEMDFYTIFDYFDNIFTWIMKA